MDNKQLLMFDSNKNRDHASLKGTGITIRCLETGDLIYRGMNKVIVSGSEFTARRHFDLPGVEITQTYNAALQLENSVWSGPPSQDAVKTYLFAVGTDGCGNLPSQVYDVDTTKWIKPSALVPFRLVDPEEDLTIVERAKYFGRKPTAYVIDGEEIPKIAYYFKAFEHDPVLKLVYADSSDITPDVWNDPRTTEAEIYVELKLQVTKEDCRDFFYNTSGINDSRLNTLSLLYCWSTTDENGYKWYQDIRPLTKYNFPNESLIDPSKGLDITYHLYY